MTMREQVIKRESVYLGFQVEGSSPPWWGRHESGKGKCLSHCIPGKGSGTVADSLLDFSFYAIWDPSPENGAALIQGGSSLFC